MRNGGPICDALSRKSRAVWNPGLIDLIPSGFKSEGFTLQKEPITMLVGRHEEDSDC